MKEILGAELDNAFKELKINTTKTYELQNKSWEYCEIYQVWKLSDKDFEKICQLSDEDWKDDWGWWRSSEGSNMGGVNKRYNINNHYINAWDGINRQEEKDYLFGRQYKNILQYFCDEIGVSTERNVCALAVDLARQNNMTMGELFRKYQG